MQTEMFEGMLLSPEMVGVMEELEEAIIGGDLNTAIKIVAQVKREHGREMDRIAEEYEQKLNQ